MPEPKAQLVDPQGPIDVPGINATGIVTATGGFTGNVQGAATGFAATTYNLNVGIVTGTKFQGNTTGNVSGLADDTNINVGIITSTSFTGDLVGNAAGLSTTTANIKAGIMTATSFVGNFTGLASGITGTPNVVAGIVTASQFVGNTPGLAAGISAGKNLAAGIVTATTFHGDGSALTGAGSTAYIRQTVGSGATIDFNNGNIIKLLHITDSVSFANTTTAADVSIVRSLDMSSEFFTSGAVEFDGSGDSLSIPDNADYNFGSGDFTIECWAKVNSINNYNDAFVAQWVSGQYCFYFGTWQGDFRLFWSTDGSGNSNLSSGYDIPTGEWHHYAASRSGDSLRLFVDGEQKGSIQSMSGVTLHNSTTTVVLGNNADVGDGSRHLNGSLSNVRIIKGTGLYTSNFTPPTSELTNITNTKLLCCQSDSSTTSATVIPSGDSITANGDPTASSNSIYPPLSSTLTWPSSITWNSGSAPTLASVNSYSKAGQVFNLVTADGGTTWYGYEEVSNSNLGTNKELWMWGYGGLGNLGVNNRTEYSSPVQVGSGYWNSIAIDKSINIGVRNDGTLWSWGEGSYGASGRNSLDKASSPTQIPGTTWKISNTGDTISAAIKSSGELFTWGRNTYGALGQNNKTHYSSPVQVPGTTWSTVTSGAYSLFATRTDGTAWALGRGYWGELGINVSANDSRSSPTQIPGTTWSTVDGFGSTTIAIKTDNTLWIWGENAGGSLGQNQGPGQLDHKSSPVQIPGTSWSKAAGCDGNSMAAIRTDGTLWTWGQNGFGELGINSANPDRRSSPVQIPGTSWSNIVCGTTRMFGLKTDGTLWGWGRNESGELGNNTVVAVSSPVQVPGTTWNLDNVSAGSLSMGAFKSV